MTLEQPTINSAEHHYQQAISALAAGAHGEAEARLRDAIRHDPGAASYHAHLGVVLKLLGRLDERIACYRRAMELDAAEPSYPANLAAALCEAGDFSGADEAARLAVQLDPARAESHFNQGVVRKAQARWSDAALCFSQAAELKQASAGAAAHPEHAAIQFWKTAAQACTKAGDPIRAVRCYQGALLAHGASPTLQRAGLLVDLADELDTLCRYDLAKWALEEALSIQPTDIRTLNLMGEVLRAQGDNDGGQRCFEKILELDPGNAAAVGNLGISCHLRGDTGAAIGYCREALAADPGQTLIWTNLGNVLTYALDHRAEEVRDTFQAWDRQVAQPLRDDRPHGNERNPERRLKIGYVSPDFRKHAVAYFALPLLENHDRTRVEVFCYYSHRQEDDWTGRFKALADQWRDVASLDDNELAGQIRADGIDVLVDLSGHTQHNRLLAFARKPAPVQVTWMGYVTTTGMGAMDWRITHADADPPGSESHYTEKLARLPGTMWCYRPLPDMPAVAPAPVLRKGHITFGSFNRYSKNGPKVLEAWASILNSVAGCHLLICVPEGESRQRMLKFFAEHGIEPGRIECFAKVDHPAFWQLHGEVDIALDPFPFGGGTTTCETLWLGVPLITCTGKADGDFAPRFASRMGYAFLNNIGHPELAAETIAEYIDKAVALSHDVPRLVALRATLRAKMARAPLTDGARFAREMESAYRDMWRSCCAFGNAEACFKRGNELRDQGDNLAAIKYYRQALVLAPNQAVIHNNIGNALKDLGRQDEAVAAFGDALRLDPHSALAHNNLGSALHELGQTAPAAESFRSAVTLAPDFAVGWRNLAATLLALKDYPAAAEAYRQAIRLTGMENVPPLIMKPAKPGTLATLSPTSILPVNLKPAAVSPPSPACGGGAGGEGAGAATSLLLCHRPLPNPPPQAGEGVNTRRFMVFNSGEKIGGCGISRKRGERSEGGGARRTNRCASFTLSPDAGELYQCLSIALLQQGQRAAALAALETAVRLDPANAGSLNDLGTLYKDLGRLEDALSCLQQARLLKPDSAEIITNLGMVCKDLHRHHEAVAHYQHALALKPDLAEARNNLALCWHEMGELLQAEQAFRHALALKPGFAIARANLGSLLKDLGRYDEAINCFKQALASDPDYAEARDNLLFVYNLQDTAPRAALATAHDYGAWASARAASPYDNWLGLREPDRSLNIGWVSGDLCIHPVGYFIDSVLTQLVLKHPGLRHVAYDNRCQRDALSARLQACCSAWHEVMGWSDQRLAEQIHADRIDILIDLAGHTAHNRLPVFAWKPAPVQVAWLGYFATTGVAQIDWLIADPHTLPESEEPHFTEKIWRLPETRLCFTPPDIDIPVGPLPASTNGGITFGCFNNLAKMNDAVVTLWSRILAAVPASRLFIKTKQLADASVRERTLSRFAAHGIAADRLTLEGPTPRADYLAAYRRIDIALDPFPYPGGTTTVEALWMGVPVLTLAGERFLSRQGVGLLMNAGLPEWVASDPDNYLARAIAHAQDMPRLAALRDKLRPQLLASPLCDAPRFAHHFALALRGMWQVWCNRTSTS